MSRYQPQYRHRAPRLSFAIIGLCALPIVVAGAVMVLANRPTTATRAALLPPPAVAEVAVVPAAQEMPATSGLPMPESGVDPGWLQSQAQRTGIGERALAGYANAELQLRVTAPDCHLAWNTLAAIGWIESGHGTHVGSVVQPNGSTSLPILGPALDGKNGHAAIPATEATAQTTGDPDWDHAAGPMQFIGSTWERWGHDGNADGVVDRNNIDDAAVTAGHYLCASGRDLSTAAGWARAVFAYNHSDRYVDAVRESANSYAG